MDLSRIVSIAGSYGESVFDTFVERLSSSSVMVTEAWLRSAEDIFGHRIDVTRSFLQLLLEIGGGVLLDNITISPVDLISTQPRRPSTTYAFYDIRRLLPSSNNKAPNPVALPDPQWLGVEFKVPGGIQYTVCYRIPDEPVTFPPRMANTKTMTPISLKITRAVLSSVQGGDDDGVDKETDDEEEEDDDDDTVLIDFTASAQRMSGPAGDFFGRETLDLRLAIAENIHHTSASHGTHGPTVLTRLIEHAASGNRGRATISTADGADRVVALANFGCALANRP